MSTVIYVWPDGTWCFDDERESMTHMSDDCKRLEVPDDVDDIDGFARDAGYA